MADQAFQERISRLLQGEALGKLKPEHQAELNQYRSSGLVAPAGTPQYAGASKATGGTGKASPTDEKALLAAQGTAATERDALKMYSDAKQSVHDFDTGPTRATVADVFLPDEGGGVMDKLGAAIGWLGPRYMFSAEAQDARQHLQTFQAKAAMVNANRLKGPASDKDTALGRVADVSPYKSVAENDRIIDDAVGQSAISGARARATNEWLTKYGSLSAPGPNGVGFEQYVTAQEAAPYSKALAGMDPHQAHAELKRLYLGGVDAEGLKQAVYGYRTPDGQPLNIREDDLEKAIQYRDQNGKKAAERVQFVPDEGSDYQMSAPALVPQAAAPAARQLPTPPPAARAPKAGAEVIYDINGNPIQ